MMATVEHVVEVKVETQRGSVADVDALFANLLFAAAHAITSYGALGAVELVFAPVVIPPPPSRAMHRMPRVGSALRAAYDAAHETWCGPECVRRTPNCMRWQPDLDELKAIVIAIQAVERRNGGRGPMTGQGGSKTWSSARTDVPDDE